MFSCFAAHGVRHRGGFNKRYGSAGDVVRLFLVASKLTLLDLWQLHNDHLWIETVRCLALCSIVFVPISDFYAVLVCPLLSVSFRLEGVLHSCTRTLRHVSINCQNTMVSCAFLLLKCLSGSAAQVLWHLGVHLPDSQSDGDACVPMLVDIFWGKISCLSCTGARAEEKPCSVRKICNCTGSLTSLLTQNWMPIPHHLCLDFGTYSHISCCFASHMDEFRFETRFFPVIYSVEILFFPSLWSWFVVWGIPQMMIHSFKFLFNSNRRPTRTSLGGSPFLRKADLLHLHPEGDLMPLEPHTPNDE